jgi:hypothetical protein
MLAFINTFNMQNLQDIALDPDKITGDTLTLKFVPLSVLKQLDKVLLKKNYKKHDIGALYSSIDTYGFSSPAKYDSNLNDGNGGLVFGNGRTEAIVGLLLDRQKAKQDPPRGVATNADGEWCIPVLFGVDQINEEMARALAIDDNNITMLGGDFTAFDMAKMWELPGYVANLAEIADFGVAPISVDFDSIASLMTGLNRAEKIFEPADDDLQESSKNAKCPHCGK